MRITLDVADDIAESAEQIAKEVGKSRESILSEALQAHFPPMSPELRAELDQWQAASDEDSAKIGL